MHSFMREATVHTASYPHFPCPGCCFFLSSFFFLVVAYIEAHLQLCMLCSRHIIQQTLSKTLLKRALEEFQVYSSAWQ